jgi:NAD+ diphosphatase
MSAGYCTKCGSKLTMKHIEGKDRPACSTESCDYVFWDNPVPVVAAIVEYDDSVILARNKSWPEKMFGLITGFLEKDESPEDGAAREVKEELGLDAEAVDFIGVYPFFQKNQLLLAYHVRAKGTITLNEEIAEVKNVPVDKLKPWPFGTGFAVRDWLEKRERDAGQ